MAFTSATLRRMVPLAAGVLGAALYIASPLAHQSFCSPLVPMVGASIPDKEAP